MIKPLSPAYTTLQRLDGDLRELSSEEAWRTIENFAQGQKECTSWDKVNTLSLQSNPQVLSLFKEHTSPVTYPEEVEDTLGTPIEVEPLDQTQLEDIGVNTCNDDIPLSFREVPSFDELKPQPHPLPNCPSLDVSLGDERGPEPPIKPHTLGWLLEDIHVTWAHLEKKQTRLQLYTKSHEENAYSGWRLRHNLIITLLSITGSLHSASNLDDLLSGFMYDLWTTELVSTNLSPADRRIQLMCSCPDEFPKLSKATAKTLM
ncbi:hypothetical protein Tco_0826708 [Tanacetum coccineum]